MPKAVSETVSHSTLTAKSRPLVRDTLKYTVLVASSMFTEAALKETNGHRKEKSASFLHIKYLYHIANIYLIHF